MKYLFFAMMITGMAQARTVDGYKCISPMAFQNDQIAHFEVLPVYGEINAIDLDGNLVWMIDGTNFVPGTGEDILFEAIDEDGATAALMNGEEGTLRMSIFYQYNLTDLICHKHRFQF